MKPRPSPCRSKSGSSQRTFFAASCTLFLLTLALILSPLFVAAADKKDKTKATESSKVLKGVPVQDLSEDEAILLALNRLGFGPRPGDIERIRQIGLQKWLDQQLHPESLNDAALDARLERFPTLAMSSAKLLEEFPEPKVAAQRAGVSVDEYRKQQLSAARSGAPAMQTDLQKADMLNMPNFDTGKMDASGNPAPAPGGGNPMFNYQEVHLPQRVVVEIAMAKMERAIYSERQLYEQMVDFWYNHFNVYAAKGDDRWLITSYERDAIRPHAMGKFRDLLEATAKSPAMLFYLDNWLSADPDAWAKFQQEQRERQATRQMRMGGPYGMPPRFPPGSGPNRPNAKGKQERGLNENYGRELMELHTLGVDGGYTQDDVIQVAKAFTGWTIHEPRKNPEFFFDERIHAAGPKKILGHTIHGGGMKNGEEVLDLLAKDPHTAHHISYEIAQRFVADEPPAALVDRMAETFRKSGGDIREVLHTMIYSPEFWSSKVYRAKVKTPFELVASAARAVGADVDVPLLLVQWTGRIGEPLYQCEPPAGYSSLADAWVNTGALLNRMNFSVALTANRVRGALVEVEPLLGGPAENDPRATLDTAVQVFLGGQASPETREILEKQLSDPQILQASLDDPVKHVNAAMIAGLVLGSPEFQRR